MLEQIDPSWRSVFEPHASLISQIEERIVNTEIAPAKSQIFRAFSVPITSYRVVIVGQDPYPTKGYANGLAFSVNPEIAKLPASLRNIFTEYVSDTGFVRPATGDLSKWQAAGVALLNTSLTINLNDKKEHLSIGWSEITRSALKALSENGCVAILWGIHAQKAGEVFVEENRIESVHPSPLSAYRGFFGSKPFTRANQLLVANSRKPINWKLA